MITESTTLAELRLLAEPARSQRHGPFGNVFLRPMIFSGIGSVIRGHKHNYDHVTFVITGSVLLEFQTPDGEEDKRVYRAGAEILIKKDVFHKFTALEDPTVATCVYALRDDPEAYQ